MVKDGQLVRRNMQREMITRDELMSQLRENGIEDLPDLKKCFLESNGPMSVIRREDGPRAEAYSKGKRRTGLA